MTQMPIRNVLRTPRRTILTAVGVGAAITALVAVLGMLDSFGRTLDRGDDEFTKGDADRVVVQLDTFYPTDSPVVAAIADAPAVGHDRRRAAAARDGARDPTRRQPRSPHRVRRSRPRGVDTDDRGRRCRDRHGRPGDRAGPQGSRRSGSAGRRHRHPAPSDPHRGRAASRSPRPRSSSAGIHANPIRTFAFLDIGDAEPVRARGSRQRRAGLPGRRTPPAPTSSGRCSGSPA